MRRVYGGDPALRPPRTPRHASDERWFDARAGERCSLPRRDQGEHRHERERLDDEAAEAQFQRPELPVVVVEVLVRVLPQPSRDVPADYIEKLYDRLRALDNVLGFYRDTFITHTPPDIVRTSSTSSLSITFDVRRSYGQRRDVDEAELQQLRQKLRQVEGVEDIPLCRDDEDPRTKLWALAERLGGLKTEQATKTVRKLLKEWGMTSPPAAMQLSELLETWANLLGEQLAAG